MAFPDVPVVSCAAVDQSVAVFRTAVVSSLGSLVARVSAAGDVIPTPADGSSVSDASNVSASLLY